MKNKIWITFCSILLTVAFVGFLYLLGYPPFITNAIKLKTISLIIIEYLKVFCTWPVSVFVSVVFLSLTFKTPLSEWLSYLKISYGGATISTDVQKIKGEKEIKVEQIPKPTNPDQPSKQELSSPGANQNWETLAQQWRLAAYLWEYSYLNYFLVTNTKRVLLWLDGINKISVEAANSVWTPLIPSLPERQAILNVLMQHHLVIMNNNQEVEITPKGKEYVAMILKPQLNG